MKVVFCLPQGTIEWAIPEEARENFSFNVFVTNVRSAGFFMAPNLYVRHEALLGIVFVTEEGPSPFVQGMTKQ